MEKHSFSFYKYCTLCPAPGLSQKASVKISSVRKHQKVNYFPLWVVGGPSEADQSAQQGFFGICFIQSKVTAPGSHQFSTGGV